MMNFLVIFKIFRCFLILCGIFFLNLQDASCDPFSSLKIAHEKELPTQLGKFYHIFAEINNSTADLYIIKLNQKYQIQLYLQDISDQNFAKFIDELTHLIHFTVAINGSYYTPDFQTLGLLVYKNNIIQKMKSSSLINTCIIINSSNKLLLTTLNKQCLSASNAIQAGPLIINKGHITEKIMTAPNNNLSFYGPRRRTAIAQTENGTILLLTTSPISLLNLGEILQNQSEIFGVGKVVKAVNLDGGSSTGMYIRFKDEPFYYHETKPVKTLLLFN